jgi:hypothetical protein
MRGYYIRASLVTESGCRGGVGYDVVHDPDYELEIGHNCNASFEMIAHAVMFDEIQELIDNPSPLFANLIRMKLEDVKKDLIEQHEKSRLEKDNG